MTKKFYPLLKKEDLQGLERKVFKVGELELLLIQLQQELFLIENRCGHFEAPLEDGRLIEKTIACIHHGISFDLRTGEIANRPWETCDPIKVFELCRQDDWLGFELDDRLEDKFEDIG